MTENEAKQWLKHTRAYQYKCDNCEYIDIKGACNEECKDFYDMAIQALEEIQQYRAIGTVEDLQKLKGVITDFPIDCGSPIKSIAEIWNQLKKYLAIGTIEDFKALKEKAEPKKIAYQIGKNGLKHEKCPTCGSFRVFGNYCTGCGQKLDWGKGEKQ